MSNYRLEELSALTVIAANGLTLREGQHDFLAPVSYSMADALTNRQTTWARVVLTGDTVVGFIRGNFDQDHPKEEFRACLWRINVAAEWQGKGVGRFAVLELLAEAKSRNFNRLTVIWERGDLGPGQFFERIGFVPIGETEFGEVIAAIEV
ncbi:MAG: GNAT family N-acetyltransferase [Microbacteriaceae bacterium]|jgi:diamine N-acetyltransferase|nr:GNAT family N-acetyltransferase [Microbacteriaceae bacterium]